MKLKFFLKLGFIFVIMSCSKNNKTSYTYHKNKFWYKILAFESVNCDLNPNAHHYIKLNAVFKTQQDSVFFDSENNLNDNYYFNLNSTDTTNFILQLCKDKCIGDSLELLIPCNSFFKQNFDLNTVPFFVKNDSVVKAQIIIKSFSSEITPISNLKSKELAKITSFFKTEALMLANKDTLGFYWVKKPATLVLNEKDTLLKIIYKGYFLNGRQMDESPVNFTIKSGVPDQLIKGLNNVIKYLKIGDNAKIILPSQLAFGEMGSKELNIPPYTPLLYEITIK